jgi:hypothetical protein
MIKKYIQTHFLTLETDFWTNFMLFQPKLRPNCTGNSQKTLMNLIL